MGALPGDGRDGANDGLTPGQVFLDGTPALTQPATLAAGRKSG
jgi:hypothetical protein